MQAIGEIGLIAARCCGRPCPNRRRTEYLSGPAHPQPAGQVATRRRCSRLGQPATLPGTPAQLQARLRPRRLHQVLHPAYDGAPAHPEASPRRLVGHPGDQQRQQFAVLSRDLAPSGGRSGAGQRQRARRRPHPLEERDERVEQRARMHEHRRVLRRVRPDQRKQGQRTVGDGELRRHGRREAGQFAGTDVLGGGRQDGRVGEGVDGVDDAIDELGGPFQLHAIDLLGGRVRRRGQQPYLCPGARCNRSKARCTLVWPWTISMSSPVRRPAVWSRVWAASVCAASRT